MGGWVGRFSPFLQATQALRVSRGIVPFFSRTVDTIWGGGQPHAPVASTPGKGPVPIVQRLGGPQGRSGLAKNFVPTGIRSRTVQTVVSRYTD